MNRGRLFAQLLCGVQFRNAIWQQVTVAWYHILFDRVSPPNKQLDDNKMSNNVNLNCWRNVIRFHFQLLTTYTVAFTQWLIFRSSFVCFFFPRSRITPSLRYSLLFHSLYFERLRQMISANITVEDSNSFNLCSVRAEG